MRGEPSGTAGQTIGSSGASVRRRSSIPTLLIVLAVFAIILFAVASFAVGGGTPASPTP